MVKDNVTDYTNNKKIYLTVLNSKDEPVLCRVMFTVENSEMFNGRHFVCLIAEEPLTEEEKDAFYYEVRLDSQGNEVWYPIRSAFEYQKLAEIYVALFKDKKE